MGYWNTALRYYIKALEQKPDYGMAKTAYDKLIGKYN
jgi:hypothetical protein